MKSKVIRKKEIRCEVLCAAPCEIKNVKKMRKKKKHKTKPPPLIALPPNKKKRKLRDLGCTDHARGAP